MRASTRSAFLDASVLVRYVTGDSPELFRKAQAIVDNAPQLFITDTILAECAFILTSFYKVPRERTVDVLVDVISKKNIAVYGIEKTTAIRALLLCRASRRVSFADAMLWAVARCATQSSRTVYTFDKRFPSDDITVLQELQEN